MVKIETRANTEVVIDDIKKAILNVKVKGKQLVTAVGLTSSIEGELPSSENCPIVYIHRRTADGWPINTNYSQLHHESITMQLSLFIVHHVDLDNPGTVDPCAEMDRLMIAIASGLEKPNEVVGAPPEGMEPTPAQGWNKSIWHWTPEENQVVNMYDVDSIPFMFVEKEKLGVEFLVRELELADIYCEFHTIT